MTLDYLARNFWLLMTIAALVWYSTITVYVAIRGSFDIQHMLKKLKEDHARKAGK